MDDLSGLDWSSSSSVNKHSTSKPTLAAQAAAFGSASNSFASYPSLRPTPPPGAAGSGRNTPLSHLSAQGSGASAGFGARPQQQAAAPPATKPGQDSFSGLINFGSGNKNSANLSLREQQERLDAEKRRKEEEKRKQNQANYGDGQFFDILGRGGGGSALGSTGTSRTGSPALAPPPAALSIARNPSPLGGSDASASPGDDDLFAAFDASTKVDQASHFPPQPRSARSTPALDLSNPSAWGKPPTPGGNGNGNSNGNAPAAAVAPAATTIDDDDDPFGLNQLQARTTTAAAPVPAAAASGGIGDDDDDDFLGDLAKPVDEVRRKAEAQRQQEAQQQQQQQRRRRRQRRPEPGKPIEGSDSSSDSDSDLDAEPGSGGGGAAKTGDPKVDNAVAQLVDYGFSAEDARRGLANSGRGLDVQSAVNWLLDDAHRQAKEKARAKQGGGRGGADQLRAEETASRGSRRSRGGGGPAWMRDAEIEGFPSRGDNRSPAGGGGGSGDDFAKTAAAMGTSFLKTANSLWKTGQKQLQKAVQDFQQEGGGDPSQPKWMRQEHMEASHGSEGEPRRRRAAAAAAASAASATDEAMMLESGARPERRQQQSSRPPAAAAHAADPRLRTDSQNSSRTQSPAAAGAFSSGPPSRDSPVPRWQQGAGTGDPRARLTKQAIEEESAQVYVSPARRRKAAAAAASPPAPEPAPPEGDLLSNSTALPARPAQKTSSPAPSRSAPARATPSPRPPRVARQVPQVNSFVLQASAKHRADGAAHFKRGDYASAHASYAASLTDIPPSHPLLVVLYCNRALTALKTGEPRQAVSDADAALAVIGPGKGEGETVSLEDGSGTTRDLKDLYGKAMTRKAEALEQMEKWAEAAQVWQACVEGGVGGATAIAGRQRCQSALKPKPKAAAASAASTASSRPASKPATPRLGAALSGLGGSGSATPTSASGRDFEAVQRLRAANQAAAREDSEKLGLLDQVDARVAAWRDGKKDNLRALLGSLERVLWEGSGWKPVGLHELVMPNKVKIVYMRAIGKTHPDKLPQDASTEIRMIAGTVFSTLNESWDKFKSDNKM
ncbi:auxilin-like clathrin-binding protein required for normal clathrin function [Sporothrix curviconia]|uniref:Auxilin-like clathrin-binding protein required for normal clathrin function n=1 Tax=Sporothrix curviconia TaxID=1260050 RepID=A0ABP0CQC0_9PEZI